MNIEQALSVISRAYDSTLDHTRWQTALDEIAGAVDATASALVVQEVGLPHYQVTQLSAAYRKLFETGEAEYYLKNLIHHEAPDWADMARKGALETLFDSDLSVGLDGLRARPDYLFLRERLHINRRVSFRLNGNRASMDALTFGFGMKYDEVPQSALSFVELVLPHIAKAVELTRTFALLRARYQAVLSALDNLRTGVALTTPAGEVIVINEEAERLIGEGDGLRLSLSRQITATDPHQAGELTARILDAGATARGQGDTRESLLRIRRRGSDTELLVEIAPLSEKSGELGISGLSGAVIFLIDPDRLPDFDFDRFAGLYALTGAETQVCRLLADGLSAPEIAEIRSTSVNTARNQAKSVLAKTNCHNRTALIRLLSKTVPPII